MTFTEYWQGLCKRNPWLEQEGKVTIRPQELKRLLRQSFDMGEKEAKETTSSDSAKKLDDTLKGFSNIFGGLKI